MLEASFQLSFKSRVWAAEYRRWGVWVAYTQLSKRQDHSFSLKLRGSWSQRIIGVGIVLNDLL